MADCTASVPDKDASGDNLYGPRWIGRQDLVDFYWYGYKFDFDWWQDGWGWDDCNNTDKPLARAFNGLHCLNYSSADPANEDYSQTILFWGGRYVRELIFPLRATCGDGTKIAQTFGAGCTASHYGQVWDDCAQKADQGYEACSDWFFLFSWICYSYTWISNIVCVAGGWIWTTICTAGTDITDTKCVELYVPFFYSSRKHVPGRASTFIHECRHIDGKPHDAEFPAGSQLAGSEGADSNWDYGGAWQYQVAWLSWYFADGRDTTDALRELARQECNVILQNAFAVNPGFTY